MAAPVNDTGWRDRAGSFARALVDRLAFLVESFAVAILVVAFLGLATARFDILGAAYVWGRFWMRIARVDDAARMPALAVLATALTVVTCLCAFVRWRKARNAFEPFPGPRRHRTVIMERLR